MRSKIISIINNILKAIANLMFEVDIISMIPVKNRIAERKNIKNDVFLVPKLTATVLCLSILSESTS